MKNIISEMAGKIDASGIRKVFALAAQLEDPINFSIGQPDFDVPDELKAVAIKAITEGKNSYSQTAGIKALNEKIAHQVKNKYGWKNVSTLVTSGVSGGLLLMFMAIINPGDEIIVPDPYFVIYKHIINMLGGKCVTVDSYPDFELPVEKIAAAITDKTKLIIVNSPCNPTGMVYDEESLKQLAKVAKAADVTVMSDEIYETFCYDGPCPSIASYHEKTILLKGFSKANAMTGWRLGYAAVNESLADLLEAMTKIQQYTFVCAPSPLQHAAVAAMDYDMTSYVDQYREKRDMIYDGLKNDFEVVRPSGAFYIFVKAPKISASEFAKKAIEHNVLIISGNIFSEKDTHFRISFATSNEKIGQGIEILKKLANEV